MLRFCNISSFLCLFFRRDLARPIGVPVKVGKDFWGMGIPYKVRPREPPNLILRFEEPLRRVRVHAFPEGSLKSRSGLRDWVNTHFTIPTKGLSLMQQPLFYIKYAKEPRCKIKYYTSSVCVADTFPSIQRGRLIL